VPSKEDTIYLKLAKKMLGVDKVDKNVEDLEKIIIAESTNFQWVKLALNYSMVITLFLIAIFRGTKNKKSLVGVFRCSDVDAILIAVLLGLGLTFSAISICVLRCEHKAKISKGYIFEQGDFVANPKSIILLSSVALFGGFLVSSSGIGGGLIFNPFLMAIDIPPPIVSATGSYMVMLTTLASTMINALNGKIAWSHFCLLYVFVAVGTYPGLIW
jgi:hypothetical protein